MSTYFFFPLKIITTTPHLALGSGDIAFYSHTPHREFRPEDPEFKVILSYMGSFEASLDYETIKKGVGVVAQLVESLSSIQEIPGSILNTTKPGFGGLSLNSRGGGWMTR